MGRAKLSMELIQKEKSRNLAFQKKKIFLTKKVNELSTLCAVKAIMIIYGPKQTPVQDNQPVIWPENHVEVLELINKYKSQPTDERKKKTSLLSNFFEDRNKKAQDDLTKLRKSNMQAKYPTWIEKLDNFSEERLNEIASSLEITLASAKKFKIMKENSSNYYAYHLQQQQKMLTKKSSMEFEESNQPNKFRITSNSRQPIYNSYNSQFPMAPLQMQVPMPMPLQQYRATLNQCTFQRTDNFKNPCVGDSSNGIYAAPFPKVEQNVAYNDPMAGMTQNINFLNNLMTAPRMPYFGDSVQSMAQNYTDGSMQPMPQNYVEYPIRSTAVSSVQSMAQSYKDGSMQPMPQNYVEYPIRSTAVSSVQSMAQSYKDGSMQPMPQNYVEYPIRSTAVSSVQSMAQSYKDGSMQPMPQNYVEYPIRSTAVSSVQSMAQSYKDGSMQPMPQNYVEYPVRSTAVSSVQSMAQSYKDGSMQPMPQNYVEYPVRSTAASSQILAFSPCQKDDHKGCF